MQITATLKCIASDFLDCCGNNIYCLRTGGQKEHYLCSGIVHEDTFYENKVSVTITDNDVNKHRAIKECLTFNRFKCTVQGEDEFFESGAANECL